MMRLLLLIIGLLLSLLITAQETQPAWGPLFLQEEVARIDIFLPQDSLLLMYTDIEYASNHEFDATFVYTSSLQTDTIENVGFRLRGNTSLQSAKKSFKVSFNAFTSGGVYEGLEKMNLNGEHNDPSILRAKMSWDMLREMDLPTCRTSHVALYANGNYMGLYLNVEHIDEEWVKKRYGPKEGNLYKCLWPADLQFLGYDEEDYQVMAGDHRVYDLKTNQQRSDYSQLVHFVDVLNHWSDADFECEIHRIFNVDRYLKMAAAEVLLGHWDAYIVNKNNYYLYENPSSGRIDFLFYDMDNTFGIDWFGVDWSTRNIYTWNFDSRPLFERMMGIPVYREQFSAYVDQMTQEYFNADGLVAHAYEVQSLITPFALADEFRTMDYGFTEDDFLSAIDEGWGNHVPMGIGEYLENRRASALSQLESFSAPQVIKETRDSLVTLTEHRLSAWLEGPVDEVKLRVIENGAVLFETVLFNQGNGLYSYDHNSASSFFSYQFIDTRNGIEVISPCDPQRVWNDQANGPLFINEIMPANQNVIADEQGIYEDWLELYNPGPSSIYLGNKFLSDDVHCKNKWQLPDQFLGPNDFLFVWADDDVSEGVLHTNFKLSASGEELAIYAPQAGALRRMDYVIFPAMAVDHSWGRATDGMTPFVIFSSSTPDASNNGGVLDLNEEISESRISVFPNPSHGENLQVILPTGAQVASMKLINDLGKEIDLNIVRTEESNGRLQIQLDRRNIQSGLYFLLVRTKEGASYSSKIIFE